MTFLSSLLSRRGRPCPSDPAPFRTLSPFAPVQSLRQNRRIAQAGVPFKTVIAYDVTSRIGAVHRGSRWNWPCLRRQSPRPSRSCHGSTCYGTHGVMHSSVQPTKCFAGRCRTRCLVLLSRTMLTSNAPRLFFGPGTGNQPITRRPTPHVPASNGARPAR